MVDSPGSGFGTFQPFGTVGDTSWKPQLPARHPLIGHDVSRSEVPDERPHRVLDVAWDGDRSRWMLFVIDLDTNELDAWPVGGVGGIVPRIVRVLPLSTRRSIVP